MKGNQRPLWGEGITHGVPSFVGISFGKQELLAEELCVFHHLCFGSGAPYRCAVPGILRDRLAETSSSDVWQRAHCLPKPGLFWVACGECPPG